MEDEPITVLDPVAEAVRKAQAGEAEAFDTVVDQLADRMWRSAWVMCRDAEVANDLVQEMWSEAWKGLGGFDFRCLFSTWLHGILRNRHYKVRRRAARKPLTLLEKPIAETTADTETIAPDDSLRRSEMQQRVRTLVADLPEAQARVIECRFFAGASLADIAVLLDCSEGTVKSRLHHGLKKLRENPEALNLLRSIGELQGRS